MERFVGVAPRGALAFGVVLHDLRLERVGGGTDEDLDDLLEKALVGY